MNTLKFITAGNVDDGKSTLIGRLLYDSDSIHTDQLGILKNRQDQDEETIDLSLITDGLRAERAQGITIDVAYKYFSTTSRKFIIADAPGHEQYTRNMITGASTSDLIIILVDARKGITAQTRRHASIGSLMGIRKAVVAVNKIDLTGFSESVFSEIRAQFEQMRQELHYDEVFYIPVSALLGDNVVETSVNTPWYKGKPLINILETVKIDTPSEKPSRFQVQWIIRPKTEAHHDYRGFAGQVLSGSYAAGDVVKILPSGIETVIEKLEKNQQEIPSAGAGENVVLHLSDAIDISRGDTIVKVGQEPKGKQDLKAWICWLDPLPLQQHKTYTLQHRFRNVRVKVKSIDRSWNVNDWQFHENSEISMNDIAQVSLRSSDLLFTDAFEHNARTGCAILIDETTHNTVGALMFLE